MAEELKMANTDTQNEGQLQAGVSLLSRALKFFFITLAAFIILALGWFLIFGGSFIVDTTTESVIVLKFGKFEQECSEGWHWFAPHPINRIIRIPITKQEIKCSNFMPIRSDYLYYQGKSKDGEAPEDRYNKLIPGIDSYVLLGDNSIMHCEWVMTYRVSDPVKYYMNCLSETTITNPDYEKAALNQPDENSQVETLTLTTASLILRHLLEDTIIVSSATMNITGTYYDKASYENIVRAAFAERVAAMDIGVSMENLTLQLVAPPLVTLESFQELLLSETSAAQEEESARTYRVEQLNAANAEKAKIQSDAEAYAKRIVSEIQADTNYFKEILAQYREKPEATMVSIFSDTLAESLSLVQDKFIVDVTSGTPNLWLKLNQEQNQKRAEVTPENEDGEEEGK